MGLLYGHAMHPKRSWVKFYPSPSVVTEYVWRLNNKKGDGIFGENEGASVLRPPFPPVRGASAIGYPDRLFRSANTSQKGLDLISQL